MQSNLQGIIFHYYQVITFLAKGITGPQENKHYFRNMTPFMLSKDASTFIHPDNAKFANFLDAPEFRLSLFSAGLVMIDDVAAAAFKTLLLTMLTC